jgi:membrane protein
MRDPYQVALNFARKSTSILGMYLTGIVKRFSSDTVFLWAGAIAFKVLVTFVPIVVLTAGLLGIVLRQQTPFATVTEYIQSFLPTYETEQAIQLIRALAEAGQTNAIIGALGLMLSAITLFSTLRIVVAGVFKRESHSRSIVRAKLFDLRMAVQVGLLFVLSIAITIFLRTLTSLGTDVLHMVSADWLWLEEGWQQLIESLGWVFPFVLTTVMFFQLYYFVPIPRPTLRSASLGAFVAGLLWELLKNGFTLAASQIGYVERFSGTVGQVGLAFGLALALILWVYYSGVVLIIGAEVAAIHEERHLRSPRVPAQQPTESPPAHSSNTSPIPTADTDHDKENRPVS